jgi:hypothetical protein
MWALTNLQDVSAPCGGGASESYWRLSSWTSYATASKRDVLLLIGLFVTLGALSRCQAWNPAHNMYLSTSIDSKPDTTCGGWFWTWPRRGGSAGNSGTKCRSDYNLQHHRTNFPNRCNALPFPRTRRNERGRLERGSSSSTCSVSARTIGTQLRHAAAGQVVRAAVLSPAHFSLTSEGPATQPRIRDCAIAMRNVYPYLLLYIKVDMWGRLIDLHLTNIAAVPRRTRCDAVGCRSASFCMVAILISVDL